MGLVLFARIGWMIWYRGPQQGDLKPIGGGKYNKSSLGNEAFNFDPSDGYVLGYFQPRLSPDHASSIALERIEPKSADEEKLDGVLVIFVATHPREGGQRIIGWYRNAVVYRHEQESNEPQRQEFSYFLRVEADRHRVVLIPPDKRNFVIPSGKGGLGQANVCYRLDRTGQPKLSDWMENALGYVESYNLENIWDEPESAADSDIEKILASTVEQSAGFQSNPRIRRAIEDYAMNWALDRLTELQYAPEDKHRNKPYDYLCKVAGSDLYVEVKGTQDNGDSVSLSPNEVEHAQKNKNSALFIVHSVKVKEKRKPVVSGGKELFLMPWDIGAGKLKPRGYVFTHN